MRIINKMGVAAVATVMAMVFSTNAHMLGPNEVYSTTVPSGVSTTVPSTSGYANCMDLQTPVASSVTGVPGMPGVRLYWNLNSDGTSISFLLQSQVACPTCGYAGAGLYPSTYNPFGGGHQYGSGSDAYVDFWAVSTSSDTTGNCYPSCITDSFMNSAAGYQPMRDTQDDLFSKTVSYADGLLYAQFSRNLTTTDANSQDQAISATGSYWIAFSCNPYFNLDNNIPEHLYDNMGGTLCSGMLPINFSTTSTCDATFDNPNATVTFPVADEGTKMSSTIMTGAPSKTYASHFHLSADTYNVSVQWTVDQQNSKIDFLVQANVAGNYQSTGEAGYVGIALYPAGSTYPAYDGGHPSGGGSSDNFTDIWVASASLYSMSRCYPFCVDDAYMSGYTPSRDTVAGGKDDLYGKSVSVDSNGVLYAQFSRNFSTGEMYDQQINLTRPYYLLYSCNPAQSVDYSVSEHIVDADGNTLCSGSQMVQLDNVYAYQGGQNVIVSTLATIVPTAAPTAAPTVAPTAAPTETKAPTTQAYTSAPTSPTAAPTQSPTPYKHIIDEATTHGIDSAKKDPGVWIFVAVACLVVIGFFYARLMDGVWPGCQYS